MSKIIDFARQQIGKPYVFATSGPDSFDCSGLTLRAAKQIGLNLYHGASTQWARGHQSGSPDKYGYWGESGTIDTLPDRVSFLFNQDKSRTDKIVMAHTGLYDGRGYVIQAGGQYKGVSDKPINRNRWSHWAVLTKEWEDRDMSESDPFLLRRGNKGEAVKILQDGLLQAGYKLPRFGADGDFGAETLSAVESFQRDNSLPVDGIWDKDCQVILENLLVIPDAQQEIAFLVSLRDQINMRLNALNQV